MTSCCRARCASTAEAKRVSTEDRHFFRKDSRSSERGSPARSSALGVSSEKRAPFAPEIPAIAEAGVPGYAATGWYGLLGPRGMRQPIVSKLSQTMANIYTDKEFNERCATVGVVPLKGNPTEFARFIQSELAKWGKVVRESGARID